MKTGSVPVFLLGDFSWRVVTFFSLRMLLYENTTIVAIATPPGHGGIGVIRLSGDESVVFLQRLLVSEKTRIPNHVSLHSLVHPESGQILDDGAGASSCGRVLRSKLVIGHWSLSEREDASDTSVRVPTKVGPCAARERHLAPKARLKSVL